MPAELISILAQLGVAGIFIWYLQKDIERREQKHSSEIDCLRTEKEGLRAELQTVRADCDADKEQLRNELAEQNRLRFNEATRYAETLWQINRSLQPILDFIQKQQRGSSTAP